MGLVVTGGLIAASETLGFSQVTGSRGVDLQTAEDGDALLSMAHLTNADETPVFGNQSESDMTVTLESYDNVEFDVEDGPGGDSVSFDLGPDEHREVDITADQDEVTIQITAELTTSGQRGRIEAERTVNIPQAGQIDVTANVQSTGGSGQFSFELLNGGTMDAMLQAIRVDSTTTDAVEVSNGSIFSIETSENEDEVERQLISDPLPVDAMSEDDETLREFDDEDSVTLNREGDAIEFNFDKFMRGDQGGGSPGAGGPPHADMQGQTVTITLGFVDGSTRQFELEDN